MAGCFSRRRVATNGSDQLAAVGATNGSDRWRKLLARGFAKHALRAEPGEQIELARREPRRDNGGTGLGLTITRSLLAAHGGTIELLPSVRGAAFEIVIPGV